MKKLVYFRRIFNIKYHILENNLITFKLLLKTGIFYLIYPNLTPRFKYINSLNYYFYSIEFKLKDIIKHSVESKSKIYVNDIFTISLLVNSHEDIEFIYHRKKKLLSNYNIFLFYLYKKKLVKAYFIYQMLYVSNNINKLFFTKYTIRNSLTKLVKNHDVSILSDIFIGDEIRYARLYPIFYYILNSLGANSVTITCDKRLYEILAKTFPNLRFKIISHDEILNIYKYGARYTFPIFSIIYLMLIYFNINTFEELSFFSDKNKYLLHNIKINRSNYRKIKVGLSWRSMKWMWYRHGGFFSLKEFEFLFEDRGIEVYICQYDTLTKEEIRFLNTKKNCIIPNVNQKDDIFNTAMLYKQLDFMISAPTYTSDLSSSLGIKTLVLTKSAMSTFYSDKFEKHIFVGKSLMIKQISNEIELQEVVKSFLKNK